MSLTILRLVIYGQDFVDAVEMIVAVLAVFSTVTAYFMSVIREAMQSHKIESLA